MTGDGPFPTIQELIEQHHALLYRYAYRLCGSTADAEDLTQQTYLIAHEKLHQLRDASSAKSWLCTILRHAYLKLRQGRPPTRPLSSAEQCPEPTDESSYDEEALQRGLCELGEEYRSAVILYYFQELSYKEIAEVLGVPLGTVMSRLSRGKTLLKELLESRETARSPAPEKATPRIAGVRLVPAYRN